MANAHFSEQVCVVYDPKDGRILHTHRRQVRSGGIKKKPDEVAVRALQLAGKCGHDTTRLEVLHVPSNGVGNGKSYKVDLSKRTLIEVPRTSKAD